ncbi:MAG: AAA family ATPase [Lachnospiraceae bacterium]|nr:RNA-binding domain-containing protein [uncultured Acetatifactor sp.]MCI9218564.1 AAA family ATPase [Lachnospiraceae bacterium]
MFDLAQFNDYREDNRREVKKAKGGLPDSIWSTYSAFANCYGGVIILGVKENEDGSWRTTGLQDENRLRRDFWNNVNNRQKVSANLLSDRDVQTYHVGADTIMVINVPSAKREQRPVYVGEDMFKGTYRRNWEGDYHCTPSEVKAMLRDQTEDTMDMKVLEEMSMDALNKETVHAYRNRHMAYRREHVWEQLEDEVYLERIGAARMLRVDGRLHPTAAGLLMFGDEYKILYEYPEYFLDYRELLDPAIRWTDRLQSSSGDWTGNLFDFFFRVYGKLVKDVKIPFRLEGAVRIDDTPVHKAIREALANCLVNTDFYLPRGVVIKKDAESIIMENPGSIRTGKSQMLKGGISDPRNKALMKMLNMIGIGERAGSGVPNIYSVWENQGWIAPEVIEEYAPDRTILKLSFVNANVKRVTEKSDRKKVTEKSDRKKVTEKTEKQMEYILARMQLGVEYRVEEAAQWLNVGRTRARTLLKMLVADGKISETGATKMKRYWRR